MMTRKKQAGKAKLREHRAGLCILLNCIHVLYIF